MMLSAEQHMEIDDHLLTNAMLGGLLALLLLVLSHSSKSDSVPHQGEGFRRSAWRTAVANHVIAGSYRQHKTARKHNKTAHNMTPPINWKNSPTHA